MAQGEAAPSNALRRWFNHDPPGGERFLTRYRHELKEPPASEALAELARRARRGPLTLIYAASDETHNNAVALREVIAQRLQVS